MPSNISTLPGLGTASYGDGTKNGTHNFNGTTYTKSFRITPQMDESNRTVRSLLYAITLCEYLETEYSDLGGEDMDYVVQNAITILSKPAQILQLTDRGISPILVNYVSEGIRDMLWGPTIKGLSITPFANQKVLIEWSIEFAVLPGAYAYDSLPQIMEYVYSLSFSKDKTGRVTRTHEGHLMIPLTRTNPESRTVPFSVDRYRDRIVPPRLVGFERTDKYSIDASRQKLSFTVTDTQRYGNPLPAGIIDADAQQSWQTTGQKGTVSWTTTLSATYTLAPGTPASVAVLAYSELLRQRVAFIENNMRQLNGAPIAVQPTAYKLEEPSIYGPDAQKVEVSTTMLVSGVGLASVLANGGTWQPVAGSDWKTWSTSINNVPGLGPYGTAELMFSVGDDVIVDANYTGPINTPP